jgi:hypothetical protein
LDFLIKKLYSKNKKDSIYEDVIIEMSDNQIFSDEDKDDIETAINKIENEPNFDYYDIENDNDYEL